MSVHSCATGCARHTYLRAGLGDGTKVVDEVGLGHTDTGIDDGEDFVLLVGDDLNDKILARIKDGWVGEGRVTDLVEGIGGVGDEFPKEDLLVRVESIYKYALDTTRVA